MGSRTRLKASRVPPVPITVRSPKLRMRPTSPWVTPMDSTLESNSSVV